MDAFRRHHRHAKRHHAPTDFDVLVLLVAFALGGFALILWAGDFVFTYLAGY